MKQGVIIVAGGKGTRMGSEIPKQFLRLCGKPVLVHTLERFFGALPSAYVTVALPSENISEWEAISREYSLCGKHTVCAGGASRTDSVRNALDTLPGCDFIAVHDGVRPMVSKELILRAFSIAAQKGTAVPAVIPADSFRVMENGGSRVMDRDSLRAVQTPQVFHSELLRGAYMSPAAGNFTDDASLVEACGSVITLFEGERSNIKITGPEDLDIAEALLKKSRRQFI